MTKYAPADSTTQWFQDNFPGSVIDPNVVVLHTTEGTTWPGYAGGSEAPTYTAMPDFTRQQLRWRQHFPDERSARALVNLPGGVETNTLGAVQVELVGTCDPAHRDRWSILRAGVDYLYWPEAPEWALRAVGRFVADMHTRHGVKLEAPRFRAYPGSFGQDNGVRMTGRQWSNFYGVCGHQHVPENDHGDPGDLPIGKVLAYAEAIVAPQAAPTPPPAPAAPETRGKRVDALLADLEHVIQHADHHPRKRKHLRAARKNLLAIRPH